MTGQPFRRVRKPCVRCRRAVQTQAKVVAPKCRPCRRSLRNLELQRYRAAALRRARARQRREWRRVA